MSSLSQDKTFANLKDILTRVEHKDAKGDTNLYNHLLEIFNLLILERIPNGYDTFEELSYFMKYIRDPSLFPEGNILQQTLGSMQNWGVHNRKELSAQFQDFIVANQKLFPEFLKVKAPVQGEGDEAAQNEPPQINPVGFVPNLLEEAKALEWAGLSLGNEQEIYRLQISLKELSKSSGATSLRVWGKILGSQSDYIVVEASGIEADPDAPEVPASHEAPGTGVNERVYFVSPDAMSPWKKLPNLSPQDIATSRLIKHVFTGNLDAPVISNPYFDGNEANLLRAQIARITHSTTLAPRDHFKVSQDDDRKTEKVDFSEEDAKKAPSVDELMSLDFWVHFLPNILKVRKASIQENRIKHSEREWPEQADAEVEMKKVVDADPFAPILRPVLQDDGFSGLKSAWTMKVVGDRIKYKSQLPPLDQQVCNAVHVISSLRWPGSHTIYTVSNNEKQGGAWMGIYIGYGLKATEEKFYRIDPPVILSEPAELQEQPEPTPLEEPVELPPAEMEGNPEENEED